MPDGLSARMEMVELNLRHVPMSIVDLFSFLMALILYISIIIAATTIRERYKHTIMAFCAVSIWSLSSNIIMHSLFLSTVASGRLVVSVESCSIARKMLWVPSSGQLCLLALDRYMTVCRQSPIPVKRLWLLYGLIPIQEYTIKIVDYSMGSPVPDEMCAHIYRMKYSLQVLAMVVWGTVVFASLINLRVLCYLKSKRRQLKDNKSIKKSRKLMQMERRLTVVYLLITIVPVIQITPGIIAAVINELYGIRNQTVWLFCFGLSSLSKFVQALLIIMSIRSIKRRILSMFSCRHRRLSLDTPSNTIHQSTANLRLTAETTQQRLLPPDLVRLQVSPGLSLFEAIAKKRASIL
ncbi:unnamed protein product, partial [Mesorhabditis spiculigera]